jgi:16S rRNA (guanine527-N7)-methyltransferase
MAGEQTDRCLRYLELLLEWNARMNLTAVRDPHEAIVKHYLDSMTALPLLPRGDFSLIDVGTGAGFPGLVIGIMRPEIRLTLLDSLKKRLGFLDALSRELGMERVETVHARAEDAGRAPRYRERFDVAAARAVAEMRVLSELCLPFVRVGGQFLAMKGPKGAEEQSAAADAQRKLCGREEEARTLVLPFVGEARMLITVRKERPTPTRYPRRPAEIQKQPL